MTAVEYRVTDARDLELIRPLWDQLNCHHTQRSTTFRRQFEARTFEDRKTYFRKVAAAKTLRLDLAFDPDAGRYIGFCVSSISPEREGEIESILVDEGYRKQGVGTTLMNRALGWLDANGSGRNRVSVGEGNEEAFKFYQRFGFFPRMTVLEQKKE